MKLLFTFMIRPNSGSFYKKKKKVKKETVITEFFSFVNVCLVPESLHLNVQDGLGSKSCFQIRYIMCVLCI